MVTVCSCHSNSVKLSWYNHCPPTICERGINLRLGFPVVLYKAWTEQHARHKVIRCQQYKTQEDGQVGEGAPRGVLRAGINRLLYWLIYWLINCNSCAWLWWHSHRVRVRVDNVTYIARHRTGIFHCFYYNNTMILCIFTRR